MAHGSANASFDDEIEGAMGGGSNGASLEVVVNLATRQSQPKKTKNEECRTKIEKWKK